MITKAVTNEDVLYGIAVFILFFRSRKRSPKKIFFQGERSLQEKSQLRGKSYSRCGDCQNFFVRQGKRDAGKEVDEFLKRALQPLDV